MPCRPCHQENPYRYDNWECRHEQPATLADFDSLNERLDSIEAMLKDLSANAGGK